MSNKDKQMQKACQEIAEKCIGCMQCVDACGFLQGIGEDPVVIAERGPSVEEAYSCSLCGLCETVCPVYLSMKSMFYTKRPAAVENNEIDLSEHRYLLPDRKVTPQTLYRDLCNIHYDDLISDGKSPVVFFPGCTMLTYSKELVRTLSQELKLKYKDLAISMECCGLPLYQLGMPERGDKYVAKVTAKFAQDKVKTLITACPNCYYQWRPLLKGTDIELLTIYEALAGTRVLENTGCDADCATDDRGSSAGKRVTVHDSCPDRADGIFAEQAREALRKKGYTPLEMEHSRDMTLCCGSGGHVSHFFRPYLSDNLRAARMNEAQKTGADILTGYCLSCVLNFAKESGTNGMKVQHVLNVILGLEQDFSEVKAKAKQLFEGPQGEEYWNRIMEEEA